MLLNATQPASELYTICYESESRSNQMFQLKKKDKIIIYRKH